MSMYFSQRDLYNYFNSSHSYYVPSRFLTREGRVCRKKVADYHRECIARIKNRDSYGVSKWYRPWAVVPALRNWHAPEGDWGVGIEVELGFPSPAIARDVAHKASGMRNITLDFEGGRNPIEATFPPVRYSKYGPKSQASRYLKMVDGLATEHCPEYGCVGIHVNVSKGRSGGGPIMPAYGRLNYVEAELSRLSRALSYKYFGRIPYGYGYRVAHGIEWKLFNTTTDWRVLRRYVDIAVSLSDLVYSVVPITRDTVVAALEAGYNKR